MNDISKLQNCITCRYGNGFHQKCYACWSDGEGSKTNWTQKETNYERYFGTPEKAARTMANSNALVFGKYQSLEWLNTEVSE